MKRFIFLASIMLLPTPSLAIAGTSAFIEMCTAREGSVESYICIGYVSAVRDIMAFNCDMVKFDDDRFSLQAAKVNFTDPREIRQVLVNYIRNYRPRGEIENFTGAAVGTWVLSEEWPCPH